MNIKKSKTISFENIIIKLQEFWQSKGCALLQPLDLEVGAGTFHPATLLRSLGPQEVELCICSKL